MGRIRRLSVVPSLALHAALAALLAAPALSGCNGSSLSGNGDGAATDQQVGRTDAPGDADNGGPNGDGGSDAQPLVQCDPLTCEGLCGPVFDRCTGNRLECGGCISAAQGEGCNPETEDCICDLALHKCTQLFLECNDFTPPVECGEIRNSCRQVRQCGYCASNQECDPLSNTCTDCTVNCPEGKCTQDECLKFGIECNVETFQEGGQQQSGLVWLGCGDPNQQRDRVDCGDPCDADAKVCNPYFNTCEPDCEAPETPEDIRALCDVTRAECGFISDGCGGRVDCGGCDDPLTEGCGIDGRPNKCSPRGRPVECESRGWECGTITDPVCSNTPLDCGACDTEHGEVCRDNHTCGPPCEVKTCDDYLNDGKCGVQLDDGCGRILAQRCECGVGQMCDTGKAGKVGSCVDEPDCESLQLGGPGQRCSAGKVFERQGLANIACTCRGGASCLDSAGKPVTGDTVGCCSMCSGADGPCAPDNACMGTQEQCCTGNLFCDTDTNTCQAASACQTFTTGVLDQKCSTVPNVNFPVGDGTYLKCECRGGDQYKNLACRNGGDSLEAAAGRCECSKREVCEVGAKFDCRRNGLWDGCGSRLRCHCDEKFGPNFVCMSATGDCCELPTCPGTAFGPGEACTISGCDRNVECDCVDDYTCYNGTCCKEPTCPGGVFSKGETCIVQACGMTERCGCESGTHCATRNNKCCTDLPDCGAAKTDGQTRRFSNECSESKTCSCASGTHGVGDKCCKRLCTSAIPLGQSCGQTESNACGQSQSCTNCASPGKCYGGVCCDQRCTLSNVPDGGSCTQSRCGATINCGSSVCQNGICYQGKCCDDRCALSNVPVGGSCKQTKCGKTRTCSDACVSGAKCYQDKCCKLPTLPAGAAQPGEVCRVSACGETATRSCATPDGAEAGAFTCGGDPAAGSDKCGCVAKRCEDELGNKICQPYTDRCGRFISDCKC